MPDVVAYSFNPSTQEGDMNSRLAWSTLQGQGLVRITQ